MSSKHWQNKVKKKAVVDYAYEKITNNDFIFIPPAFAFSLTVGFIPILFIMSIILGSNATIANQVHAFITTLFGDKISSIINVNDFWQTVLQSPLSALSVIVLIIISSWIAASGFAKFIYTTSHIYDHDRLGGFWMNRLRGMTIVVLSSLYLAGTFTLLTFVSVGLSSWGGLQSIQWLASTLLWVIVIPVATLAIYFGLGLLFKFSPRFKLSWRQIHPGIVVATVPTSLFLFLFTTITTFTLNYSAIGGQVAGFMTLCMSMLILSYFIYVGLIANAAFYKTYHMQMTIRKNTVSKK